MERLPLLGAMKSTLTRSDLIPNSGGAVKVGFQVWQLKLQGGSWNNLSAGSTPLMSEKLAS